MLSFFYNETSFRSESGTLKIFRGLRTRALEMGHTLPPSITAQVNIIRSNLGRVLILHTVVIFISKVNKYILLICWSEYVIHDFPKLGKGAITKAPTLCWAVVLCILALLLLPCEPDHLGLPLHLLLPSPRHRDVGSLALLLEFFRFCNFAKIYFLFWAKCSSRKDRLTIS